MYANGDEVGGRQDWHFRGQDGASALTRIGSERGLPKTTRVDNGSEFTLKALDQWAHGTGVALDFSRPEKPTDNALIESVTRRLRAGCLNVLVVEDAEEQLEAWLTDYNEQRPDSALEKLAPRNFASILPG